MHDKHAKIVPLIVEKYNLVRFEKCLVRIKNSDMEIPEMLWLIIFALVTGKRERMVCRAAMRSFR